MQTKTNPPKILIAGTGAMACLFAARLARTGVAVHMLGNWSEGLQALQQHGVGLSEANGKEFFYPVRCITNDTPPQVFKDALVLVKSWQTDRTATQLDPMLHEKGVALTLQNGVGNREILTHKLGAPRVALGIATLGANLLAPGLAQSAGEGVVSLSVHSRLGDIAELLHQAGFIVESAPDPDVLLWGKLVINAAINPLTAILGVTNGELLTRPTARTLLVAAAREAAAVAVALGIRLPYPDPVEAAETIAQRTAANHSSMLQDVMRGAPTEIDAICGAIVHAGEQVNVQTPVNRILWQLVKAKITRSTL